MKGNPAESRSAAYHHGDLRRTLVTAAMELINETQQWEFSLREVARRAGVSHNAPYAHFRTKRELLGAIAATGFQTLRAAMLAAADSGVTSREKLKAIGLAYLQFGQGNRAHYRLMFGPTLSDSTEGPPSEALEAARNSRAVLEDAIRQGALDGEFNVDPQDPAALAAGVFGAWSLVHGLTLLFIDGLAADETTMDLPQLAERVSQLFAEGLMKR